MRFRFVSCLCVLLLCPAVPALAGPAGPFVGQLEKGLVPDLEGVEIAILKPLPTTEVPLPLAEGERAFGGAAPLWSGAQPLPLILVESAEGKTVALLYDRDRDGKIAAGERASVTVDAAGDFSVEIRLPLKEGPFSDYPVIFRRFKGKVSGPGIPEGGRFLAQSKVAFLAGAVDVEGRPVRVRYVVTPGEALDPRSIEQGVDGDGDGRFGGAETPETDGGRVGQSEPPVFPVGALYLSTSKLDVAAGRIEMVSHPASDYRRVSLVAGAQIPDFSFTDYAGKAHKLSDLKGKHVLLDFWASWCAPCVADFPRLKEIYAAYRGRGLEILTIAWNDTMEKSGKLVEKEQLPWLQGTAESTAELASRDLRLPSVPFSILLDPQGKILTTSTAEPKALRGDGLKETIDKLLPKAPAAAAGT